MPFASERKRGLELISWKVLPLCFSLSPHDITNTMLSSDPIKSIKKIHLSIQIKFITAAVIILIEKLEKYF
jgi:hypothetical protein